MTKLTPMRGEEFVKRILDGEREFSNIELEKGFNLSGYEGFNELQNYLKNYDLRENPVIINNSDFSYVRADGLYLPYVQGIRAKFEKAYLREADLLGASLMKAYLKGAYLLGANLKGAYL